MMLRCSVLPCEIHRRETAFLGTFAQAIFEVEIAEAFQVRDVTLKFVRVLNCFEIFVNN